MGEGLSDTEMVEYMGSELVSAVDIIKQRDVKIAELERKVQSLDSKRLLAGEKNLKLKQEIEAKDRLINEAIKSLEYWRDRDGGVGSRVGIDEALSKLKRN